MLDMNRLKKVHRMPGARSVIIFNEARLAKKNLNHTESYD